MRLSDLQGDRLDREVAAFGSMPIRDFQSTQNPTCVFDIPQSAFCETNHPACHHFIDVVAGRLRAHVRLQPIVQIARSCSRRLDILAL